MKPKEPEALGARLPMEVKSSRTEFALFGELDRKNVLFIKSENASLELLGLRPLEAVEISSAGGFQYIKALLTDFLEGSTQSVMSAPMQATSDSPGMGKLSLVWHGIATWQDKLIIKKILDRNAVDIGAAALKGDFWQSTLSIAPVIAECRRVHKKNRFIQIAIWLIIVTVMILILNSGIALIDSRP